MCRCYSDTRFSDHRRRRRSPKSRLIAGRDLYANSCSACHGSAGEGGKAPSLHDVRETFPSCDAHIERVTLGSQIWKQVHGATYGANNIPITGVMPSHREQFTAEQIALVSAFERFQYGAWRKRTRSTTAI